MSHEETILSRPYGVNLVNRHYPSSSPQFIPIMGVALNLPLRGWPDPMSLAN